MDKWSILALGPESGLGWRQMANYHLYYIRQNMLMGSDDIEAADDNDAARIAGKLGSGGIVEVWNANRRVRVVAAKAISVSG